MPFILERLDKVLHHTGVRRAARRRSPNRRAPTSPAGSTAASSTTTPASRNRDAIGVGQMVFEVDYPHQDTTWPNTTTFVEQDRRPGQSGRAGQDRPDQRHRSLGARDRARPSLRPLGARHRPGTGASVRPVRHCPDAPVESGLGKSPIAGPPGPARSEESVPVEVRLPTVLRSQAGGQSIGVGRRVHGRRRSPARSSPSTPAWPARSSTTTARLHQFVNVYVNDDDVRYLGARHTVKDGDVVSILPAVAGGA